MKGTRVTRVALLAAIFMMSQLSFLRHILVPSQESEQTSLEKRGRRDFSVRPLPSNSDKKSLLCTVVKDPNRRYIDEWADYHVALGFDRVHVYDNTENFALSGWGWDKDYADRLEVFHFLPGETHNITQVQGWTGAAVQSRAFMDCAWFAKANNYSWVAGFDIDEFLVPKDPGMSVGDLMEKYCPHPCGQLSFNWVLFGPDNRKGYVPVPVTRRFTSRIKSGEWDILVKGIADPNAMDPMGFWMHTFLMDKDSGRTWLDTAGRTLTQPASNKLKMLMNPAMPRGGAVIHHYKTLSEGEWKEKNCERKDVNAYDVKKDCETSAAQKLPDSNGRTFDDSAWQRLRALVPGYQIFDDLSESELG